MENLDSSLLEGMRNASTCVSDFSISLEDDSTDKDGVKHGWVILVIEIEVRWFLFSQSTLFIKVSIRVPRILVRLHRTEWDIFQVIEIV